MMSYSDEFGRAACSIELVWVLSRLLSSFGRAWGGRGGGGRGGGGEGEGGGEGGGGGQKQQERGGGRTIKGGRAGGWKKDAKEGSWYLR